MSFDWKKDGKRLLVVCLGATIMAFNLKIFVRTGELFPGGAAGLTVLIQRLALRYLNLELPYSIINLLLNAFPVYVGFRFIGMKFTLLSLVTIMVPGFLTALTPAYVVTYDILLICIFGGILNGAAASLCLSQDATTGGTDFLAIYLSQKRGVETWNLVLGFNAIILLTAGFFFGWDKALYSIVYQYVSTQTLHLLYRNYQRMSFFIVTEKAQEVCDAIYAATHHGATIMQAEGSHEHRAKQVVYSVVSAADSKKAMKAVTDTDPEAFVNSFRTQEIHGHFYMKPKD